MRLKEFALEWPGGERAARTEFRLQTRCISALFERFFGSMTVKQGWKVLAECVDAVERQGPPIEQLGVLETQVEFDHSAYAEASDLGRKKMALAALYTGALAVAAHEGWETEQFTRARDAVVDAGYVNEWTWPKPRSSANRQMKAYLCCHHDPDRFHAELIITDKAGHEIASVDAIDTTPSEFSFAQLMGKVVWTGNKQVTLRAKDGKAVAALTVPA
jgi:hypothetical protein